MKMTNLRNYYTSVITEAFFTIAPIWIELCDHELMSRYENMPWRSNGMIFIQKNEIVSFQQQRSRTGGQNIRKKSRDR